MNTEPHKICDAQVARMSEIRQAQVHNWRTKFTDLPDSQSWPPTMAMAFVVRRQAIKAGASRAGATSAWGVIENCDLEKMRDAVAKGYKYLRIWGDACDTKPIDAEAAFNPIQFAKSVNERVAFAIVDLGVLMSRLDASLAASAKRAKRCDFCGSKKSRDDSTFHQQPSTD